MLKNNNKTFLLIALFTSYAYFTSAQYGGGYGGYGGGYGGYGGGRMGGGMNQNIPQSDPKFSPPDPEKVADEETKWMQKKLDITEEQLPYIDDMNLKFASLRSDLYATLGEKPDQEKMERIRAPMIKLNEDKEKELLAILTETQKEKYKKLKEKKK